MTDDIPDPSEDPWVDRIIHEYPDVVPVLDAFDEETPADEREHRLTKLGVAAGVHLARTGNHPACRDVESALSAVVQPAIRPLATGKVGKATIRVSRSVLGSPNLDMMFVPVDDRQGYCSFLSGLVMGLLNETPGVPRVRVTETTCRCRGDAVCTFEVEVI